jgi:endoglucanase
MHSHRNRRIRASLAAGVLTLMMTAGPGRASVLDDGVTLAVSKPNHAATEQVAALRAAGAHEDAELIRAMVSTPQADWIESGTPKRALQQVRNIVSRANDRGTVPVLVAYNIPFRDCAQFSAGGATSVAEYKAWIDGVAAGIGDGTAVVILEPDGLGIIPFYDPYAAGDGNSTLEWCQPPEADPETAAADRFEMLNHAVDALKAQPNAAIYLDGTHSAWLGVGDIAHRLAQAGVDRADGFFLNVSNYQYTANSVQYGTWISQCLAAASTPEQFAQCPNQYWNGGPLPAKIAELLGEWTGVALSPYGIWTDESEDPALNTSGINLRYSGAVGTTHFVVDTSRNGVGPWQPPADRPAGDPQDWCNPPDRGLGLRPTTDTGRELLDAYLWVKIPGESDGQCNRWAPPGSPDPVRGMIDPPAGAWFPEQALELARLADPPLGD